MSFNFQQEMKGIFASHGDPSGRSVMLLLDAQHRVIASSDEGWMPLGLTVPVNREGRAGAFIHQGRFYLIATHASPGYQGYPGPTGWLGQVMMPLDVAFDQSGSASTDALPPALLQGLLSHAGTFCPPLHDIMVAAQRIQRIVWNGQVMTAGSERDMSQLKTVLEQISETGHRSSKLFRESIDALYQTVLGTGLTQAGYTARLLVDLLDRNLYERADDCRWWALNPQLREGMAAPDANACASMAQVLDYINSLYTVYTRLYLYNAQGAILVSTGTPLPDGARVTPDTLAKVMALTDTQHYHVEGFGPHPLYADAATYVYHAAIRHPQDPKRVIGGIGLVFDSAPELRAMLDGAVSRKTDTHALFVSPQGRVLASTHPDHPVGSPWTHPVPQHPGRPRPVRHPDRRPRWPVRRGRHLDLGRLPRVQDLRRPPRRRAGGGDPPFRCGPFARRGGGRRWRAARHRVTHQRPGAGIRHLPARRPVDGAARPPRARSRVGQRPAACLDDPRQRLHRHGGAAGGGRVWLRLGPRPRATARPRAGARRWAGAGAAGRCAHLRAAGGRAARRRRVRGRLCGPQPRGPRGRQHLGQPHHPGQPGAGDDSVAGWGAGGDAGAALGSRHSRRAACPRAASSDTAFRSKDTKVSPPSQAPS